MAGIGDLHLHVAFRVVGVDAGKLLNVLEGKEALSALLLEGVFDIMAFALAVDPREGMAAIADRGVNVDSTLRPSGFLDVPVEVPAVRVAGVGEEHGSGMVGFWNVSQKVKGGVVVDEERLWVATLAADNIWALHGVASEEDRPVQSNLPRLSAL